MFGDGQAAWSHVEVFRQDHQLANGTADELGIELVQPFQRLRDLVGEAPQGADDIAPMRSGSGSDIEDVAWLGLTTPVIDLFGNDLWNRLELDGPAPRSLGR